MMSTRCQYSPVTSISGLSSSLMFVRESEQRQPRDQNDADREMDGVDAGDEPVESEEQLRAGLLQGELRARHQMLLDILLVLKALHHQEGEAQCGCRCQAAQDQAAQALLWRPPPARPPPW